MAEFHVRDSLGSLPPEVITEYLRDVGDAQASTMPPGSAQGLWGKRVFEHTGFAIGFLPDSAQYGKLQSAYDLQSDEEIKGKRIKITLNEFYVHDYPGSGEHKIICEFTGKNQVEGKIEELRFVVTGRSANRDRAGIRGKPIFMGLTVGDNGVSFEGRTINVESSTETELLNALQSDVFREGLNLVTHAQPAIKPFTGLALGVVKFFLSRNKNKQIHNFELGMDFSSNKTSVRLRYGSYVVVQTDALVDWENYVWKDGAINNVRDGSVLPFNYIILGVSPFAENPTGRQKK